MQRAPGAAAAQSAWRPLLCCPGTATGLAHLCTAASWCREADLKSEARGGPASLATDPRISATQFSVGLCNTGAATQSRHPTVYPPALNTNQHTERDTTFNSIYSSYQDNVESLSSNNAAVLSPVCCPLSRCGEVRMCGESDLRDRQSQYFCQKLPGESQRRCNNVCNNQRRSECTPSPQPSHVLSATKPSTRSHCGDSRMKLIRWYVRRWSLTLHCLAAVCVFVPAFAFPWELGNYSR